MIRPVDPRILMDDNPVLRNVSSPVPDDEITSAAIEKLAETMIEICEDRNAAGLAAIQIGVPLRVIVARHGGKVGVMVNPVITRRLNREVVEREGCLSVRAMLWGPVSRPAKCEVTYTTLSGQIVSLSLSGRMARIIQHECDHLDGVLLIDRKVA